MSVPPLLLRAFVLGLCAIGSAALSERALSQTGQPAPTPPIAAPPNSTVITPTPDPEKRELELQKLRAEIGKLEADKDKAHLDAKTGWIAPAVSAITIIILVATLWMQRSTALKVQERQRNQALDVQRQQNIDALNLQTKQGAAALELQKRQGDAALELKIVELVMSSRSPALARGRAELLNTLRGGVTASTFLDAVNAMTANRQFPGDLGFELRLKVFQELAGKYKHPADVAVLARNIFKGDDWLKEDLTPPEATG